MPGVLNPAHLPFPAIFGMGLVKRAVLCAVVNPGIRGVLIRGGSGTGKTTVVRSLGGIDGRSIVNVPLNVTDEQLFGSLDIETAIREGRVAMEPGLMERADGNLLYMDDVDLFDPKLLSSVMEAVHEGSVKVEREGLSAVYGCDTVLFATMNSHNSHLTPGIADGFDIHVNADFPEDAEGRLEVLRRNLEHADEGLHGHYDDETDETAAQVAKAQRLLAGMVPGEEVLTAIANICQAADIDGFRGDLSMLRVSMALAALDGRDAVSAADIEEAAVLCLPHRRKPRKGHRESGKKREYELLGTGESHIRRAIHDDRRKPVPAAGDDRAGDGGDADGKVPQHPADAGSLGSDIEDVITRIGEVFETIDLFEEAARNIGRATGDSGMRRTAVSRSRSGRYVGSRLTDDKNPDLAFDATVRAAALHQRRRRTGEDGELAVIIDKSDLREKVREARSTTTFLFAVDASGSLIIRNRMMAVKGAILSLLKQHYAKRDRVGIMTFNSEAIKMVLPPSKSVESVHRILDDLPVGRRTPLSAALVYISDYMTVFTKQHRDEQCHVVLVTDGNANVALDPDDEATDPLEEALGIASKLSIPNVSWIVIDTEKPSSEVHNAERFADKLRADYYTLEDLRA